MRRVLVLCCTAIVLVGLVSGCQASAQEEERAALDEAIHSVEHEFASFYLLGPEATTADVRSVTERLSSRWKGVEQAAEGVEGMDIADAVAAHQDLIDAVEALPEDTETGEPMQTVMPLFEAFKAKVEEVHESGHFHD